MAPLFRAHSLSELTIEDERSFRHVGIYHELKRALAGAGVRFLVAEHDSGLARHDPVLLLNLAFWRPGEVAEVLIDDHLSADQLAHNAWHYLAHRALGEHARTADGMLLAEAIASAFDVYLVGRLLGHAPQAEFLATQVPAMRDAAVDAGLAEIEVERLLTRMASEPERCFEELRQVLFDTALALVGAPDLEDAARALVANQGRPFWALLHHYELPSWVLYARAYSSGRCPSDTVRQIDAALRAADDPLAWLERQWIGC